MSASRSPRTLADAVRGVREEVAPETMLAAVQGAWREAVGDGVAEEASPVAERDGVVIVECRAATWAQELDLLQGELLEKLNALLAPRLVAGLRFVASGSSPG
jgi:predicted nucleic acid-binding Zn ribbon protein